MANNLHNIKMMELITNANIQKDAQATWSLSVEKRTPNWQLMTIGNWSKVLAILRINY
jgi:hypothetical protein